MLSGPVGGVINVATIIIVVAIIVVLVSKKTQTANLIQSFSTAFDKLLKVEV